jgi:hypothetical protein
MKRSSDDLSLIYSFLPVSGSRVGSGVGLGESASDEGTRNDFLEAEAEVEELSPGSDLRLMTVRPKLNQTFPS